MARYVIGDVQGCFASLQALLSEVGFDPLSDRLWLVGDLVNRGPQSLEVLRFVRSLGDAATVVLGNHDLYLLMVAAGWRKRGKDDTLQAVIDAPDAAALLGWVASRPLMHVEDGFAMVHAGLLPQWSVARARALAGEVEAVLRGPGRDAFLAELAGNTPARWDDALGGYDRLRCIVNAMTRMRFCTAGGAIEFRYKGPPTGAPPGCVPWFEAPNRYSSDTTLLVGHWSALGVCIRPGLVALDSGCVWGGALTAYRLEDGAVFQTPSREARPG
ncbi:MAG: symmetrical bis(5'-nucleosyl)-tetraphosphatase [Rhodocyclaceae bacterium]|nr:symmetrical bis(5'-nucleosyl)-tetraphosphatase [Rhodocyclaceae bacterium]